MAQQLKSYLKGRFVTGAKPSQQDYSDWLDSYVHKDDLTSLNNATIDARITTYDSALRSRNIDGAINSLGDVFYILRGFDDADDVKELLDSVGGSPSWDDVEDKPTDVIVTWEEQVVSMAAYAPDKPAAYESIEIKSCASFGNGPLKQAATRYFVKDIFFSRIQYQPAQPSNIPFYYADRLQAVVFAIAPKVKIS
jgi:hypothetical protein